MKNKKTDRKEAASKVKVKIKNLKLTKETIENVTDTEAGAIKGGGWSSTIQHNEAFVCDEG